jgi:hypothetical protein
MGGGRQAASTSMDYVTIATTGNPVSFGLLTAAVYTNGGTSNSTRGVSGGGQVNASPYYTSSTDQITIATTGNATVFGTLAFDQAQAGVSSGSNGGMV